VAAPKKRRAPRAEPRPTPSTDVTEQDSEAEGSDDAPDEVGAGFTDGGLDGDDGSESDDDTRGADSGRADPDDASDSDSLDDSEASDDSRGDPDSRSIARYDALETYMREVQRHPLLSPEDEHTLAVEYAKTGSVDLAARLVTANLRLVVKIAYEYRRAYRNIMDMVQEGNIGLMQAVKRYDPYRGVKLSSYAAWWIRAYMLRFILNNWRLVKIGTTQAQRRLFFNLSKEKA
jgi:RNA polymerase sigma-32 factor